MDVIEKIRTQKRVRPFVKWIGLCFTIPPIISLLTSVLGKNETATLSALDCIQFVLGLIIYVDLKQMGINQILVDEIDRQSDEINRLKDDLALDAKDS